MTANGRTTGPGADEAATASIVDTRRIVFLDVDGVLTTTRTPDACLDADLLERFQIMLWRSAWPAVVLASDWRLEPALLVIVRRELDIFDVIPSLQGQTRGAEIELWLSGHPEVVEFVILDDQDEFLAEQRPHLVRTTLAEGLTEGRTARVVELFASGALRRGS